MVSFKLLKIKKIAIGIFRKNIINSAFISINDMMSTESKVSKNWGLKQNFQLLFMEISKKKFNNVIIIIKTSRFVKVMSLITSAIHVDYLSDENDCTQKEKKIIIDK